VTRCAATAQDVAQHALITLYEHLSQGRFTASANLGAWVGQVAFHKAAEHLRRRKLRDAVPLDRVAEDLAQPEPVCPLERAEALAEAFRRIEQLPEQQRRVFTLRVVEGWDYARIASALGITATTAERHYYKAMARLRAPSQA